MNNLNPWRHTAISGCASAPLVKFSRVLLAGVLATLLTLVSPLAAQTAATGSITGKVTNAITGRVVNNARVVVEGTSKSTFTDEYGQYRLAQVPAGTATLKVFFTGLDEQTVAVEVGSGASVQQNVILTSAARVQAASKSDMVTLDTFVVEAKEQDGSAIAINEQRFSSNLKNVVAADAFGDVTEGNPGEFLKYLPGVSVDYVAADVRSISVRGFGSAFTSMSMDGNRMASAASSGASRSFELEQVSMNNVARMEVVKVPTPSMPADSLGGSVNMISKNAFERDQAELSYRLYTSISNEDVTLGKTPGPDVERSRKIRPGYDFSYSNPLTENFGLIINGLHSDQFNEQHRSRTSWQTSGGAVASASNPYMRTYTIQDGPKETRRDSIGLNGDWKLTEHDVLSMAYQWNDYDSFFGNRNYNINAGSNATDFDSTYVNGRAGAGEVSGGSSHRHKFGTTQHISTNWKHYGETLDVNAGVYYSYATNKYRDAQDGHFSGVNVRVRSLTVGHSNIVAMEQPTMSVKNSTGADVDWTQLSNFRLRSVRAQEFDSWDEYKGGNLDFTKRVNGLAAPLTLKFGLNVRQQQRDIIRRQDDYDYLGPDGSTESADDSAAPFLDEVYINQDPHYGVPAPQYADPYKVYQHFLAHPDYFRANVNNWQNRAQNDYNITERVSAAYLQGDWTLLGGKMKLLGGVRFEKTDVDGIGFKYDEAAIRDANGNLLTTDTYTQRRMQYQRRAAAVSNSYDGYYPSLHLVYNVSDDLIFRLAYARTIGRPDFSNILPGTVINIDETAGAGEPGGNITVRNTGLKPYTSDNFDASLEYYFKPAGVISAGVFHKKITDFFGSIAKLVDADDLAAYNLDPEYLGFNLSTKTNSGDAKITGMEFNYNQQLVMLPGIWSKFSLFGNATILSLDGGNNADFSGFIEKTGNWGVSYNGDRFNAKVKWNYRGKQFRSFQSAYGTGGAEYYDDRLYLDLNFDYEFSRRLTAFFNVRNVMNVPQELLRYGDTSPEYAWGYQQEEFGVQFSLGIKGKW